MYHFNYLPRFCGPFPIIFTPYYTTASTTSYNMVLFRPPTNTICLTEKNGGPRAKQDQKSLLQGYTVIQSLDGWEEAVDEIFWVDKK
jgi:hypothetical protein